MGYSFKPNHPGYITVMMRQLAMRYDAGEEVASIASDLAVPSESAVQVSYCSSLTAVVAPFLCSWKYMMVINIDRAQSMPPCSAGNAVQMQKVPALTGNTEQCCARNRGPW